MFQHHELTCKMCNGFGGKIQFVTPSEMHVWCKKELAK